MIHLTVDVRQSVKRHLPEKFSLQQRRYGTLNSALYQLINVYCRPVLNTYQPHKVLTPDWWCQQSKELC